jgi:hypothetical protein
VFHYDDRGSFPLIYFFYLREHFFYYLRCKTILLEGQRIEYSEVNARVADFVALHKWYPDVLADNSERLSLGIAEEDLDEPTES